METKMNFYNRRKFLKQSTFVGTITGISGLTLLSGCKKDEDKKVSPPEDLMQEHGLLERVLLIYDFCKIKLINKESVPFEVISDAATIIRTFVEDYHEMHEEIYLFPRFQRANQLSDLTTVLLKQHQAGRSITKRLIQLASQPAGTETENQKIIELLTSFNTMYRPHKAREDTVLFPAFRKLLSQHEYNELGETFEDSEHKLFGEDGFETMVEKVAGIEKQLGIYELAQFSPHEISMH